MQSTAVLKKLDHHQLRNIYHRYMKVDFPPDELRALEEFEERIRRGIYECLGLFEEDELRAYGFFTIHPERSVVLLDFLAVCPEHRGNGYGSRFLQLARAWYKEKQGILIECESERTAADAADLAVRRNRIHFYEKNGCVVTCGKTLLDGVEFNILYLKTGQEDADAVDSSPDSQIAGGTLDLQIAGRSADSQSADRISDPQVEMEHIYRLMFGEEGSRKNTKAWKRRSVLKLAESWNRNPETDEGTREARPSLLHAMGFSEKRQIPRIISLVGAGGKTTTMYQLADELAEMGCRVLVTTSTHIGMVEDAALVEHASEIQQELWQNPILTAGTPTYRDGEAEPYKLSMPQGLEQQEELQRILEFADVILVEADGAKRFPLKVPNDWEPVILPQTGLVVACAGLSACAGENACTGRNSVGLTFGEGCFRFEDHGGWLKRQAEDRIQPSDIALILMDGRGSHKAVDGRYYRIVLNQADGEEQWKAADWIWRALPITMQEGCVVTAYGK